MRIYLLYNYHENGIDKAWCGTSHTKCLSKVKDIFTRIYGTSDNPHVASALATAEMLLLRSLHDDNGEPLSTGWGNWRLSVLELEQ